MCLDKFYGDEKNNKTIIKRTSGDLVGDPPIWKLILMVSFGIVVSINDGNVH